MEKICKSIDEQIEILAERNLKIDKINMVYIWYWYDILVNSVLTHQSNVYDILVKWR